MERRPLVKKAREETAAAAAEKGGTVTTSRDAGLRLPVDYDSMKSGLSIDGVNLDNVVERQAIIFAEVAERHALAVSARDGKKDELARREAEIAREFRRQCEENKTRATDETTREAVAVHPDRARISGELLAIKREADLWYALRESFSQRVEMIPLAVKLFLHEHFGSNTIEGSRREARDAMAEEARKRADADRRERREREA